LILELTDPRVELSPDELRAAAERARTRLENEGQIDGVADRQGVGADAAPAFDSLEGKTFELRWRYHVKRQAQAGVHLDVWQGGGGRLGKTTKKALGVVVRCRGAQCEYVGQRTKPVVSLRALRGLCSSRLVSIGKFT